jgi:hypothetical protein
MKFFLFSFAAIVTHAFPQNKKCTEQAGSLENGVPDPDGTFTAMGATWEKKCDAWTDSFEIVNGNQLKFLDTAAYGFFAISDAGDIDTMAGNVDYSICQDGCDRLACVSTKSGDEWAPIQFTADLACDDVSLVVGWANLKTSGNTLQFLTLDLCDPANITVVNTECSDAIIDQESQADTSSSADSAAEATVNTLVVGLTLAVCLVATAM